MLVIVHHRNIQCPLQALLYIEALRSLDVLQIDTAECRCYLFHGLTELLRVFLGNFNVKHVDAAVNFEEQSLAFHYGLAAQRANVTEAEHGRSVAYHGHQIALVGISVSIIRVLLYLKTGICHTRRICKAEVCLCAVGLGRFHLNLTRSAVLVIF